MKESDTTTTAQLRAENAELRVRLAQAEEALRTIRSGTADAGSTSAAQFQEQQRQLRDSRLAALNLMQDAIEAREETQRAFVSLKASEERYRRLFTNLQEGFYLAEPVFDASGACCDAVYLDVNPAFERIMGQPREQLVGRRFKDVLPSIKTEWMEVFGRVTLTGEAATHESFSDALHKYFEAFVFSPLPGQFGVLVTDITTRKQAEKAAVQSQHTFAELIERAPFGIYVVDSEFRIAQMNIGSQMGAFKNVRPVIGRAFTEAMHTLWPEPVAREIIGHFRHTLETGEPFYSNDFIQTRGDVETEEAYEWELHRMALPNEQYGVICYYYDSTKLRAAERAVRESEERLRLAISAARLASWDWHVPSGKVLWNDDHYRMLGYEPGTVAPSYEAWKARMHPEDSAATEAQLRHSMEQGGDYHAEFRILWPDGTQRWLEARGYCERDSAGQAIRSYGVMADITERKQAEEALHRRAEEALRLSEREFRSLAESMPQIVWATRADGWNIYFNQQWADYTGMTMEESYGHGWNTPFHPDDKQRAWEAWQRATQHNEPYSLECRLRRADGAYRWWLIRGAPMLGANGEILKWFGTCTDIEEIKRAEAALQEANDLLEQRVAERTAELRSSEERHRLLAETMLQGIVHQDATGTIIAMNPAAERILGKTRAHFLNSSSVREEHDTIRENGEPFPGVEHPSMVSLRSGQPLRGVVMGVFNPQRGEYRWISIDAVPVCRPGETQPSEVYAVFEDITDRKLAEDALRASELRERERAEELAVLIEAVPIPVFIARDPDCLHLTGNRLADDILRIPHGNELSMSASADIKPCHFRPLKDGRELRLDELPAQRSARGVQVKDFEFSIVFDDGMIRHVLGYGTPLLDAQGQPRGTVAALVDITARKLAEERLRDLTQRLTYHVDNSPLAVIEWGPDMRLVRWSGEAEHVFGWTADEVLGKRMEDLHWIYEEDQPQVADVSEDLQTGTNPRRFSANRNYRKDGSVVHCEWYNSSLMDESGHLHSILSLVLDVSERKNAEEAQRASEERFRDIARASADWIWEMDREGRYTLASEGVKEVLGYEPADILGRTPFDLMPPDEAARVRQDFQAIASRQEAFRDLANVNVHRNGGRRDILTSGVPVFDAQGALCGYRGVDRDVTERKRAEAALRASEELFHAAFEGSAVPMSITALDGRMLRINAAFCQMLGYSEAELLALTFYDFTHPDDLNMNLAGVRQMLSGKQTSLHMEKRYVRKDGRILWGDMSTAIVRGADSHPLYMATHVQDITARKQAEAQMRFQARLLDAVGQTVVSTDLDQRITYWNKAAALLFGWTSAEVLGQNLAEVTGLDQPPENTTDVMALFRQGETWTHELSLHRRDGTPLPMLTTNAPVFDEQGKLTAVIGVGVDLTERKRTEDVLRFLGQFGAGGTDEGFFHALARYLARTLAMDFVCIDRLEEGLLTAQTLAVFHNGRFEDNISYTLKDTPCGDVVGRKICCFPKNVRGLFAKDTVLQDLQAESYLGTTLWSSQGKPIGLIAVIGRQPLQDTRFAESVMQMVAVRASGELERQQAEQAIIQLNKELDQRVKARTAELAATNRELEAFCYSVSHDLRAPLRGMDGFSQALLEDYGQKLDASGQDFLHRIRTNCQRMARLIDDLLQLSRLTRATMRHQPVDLTALAQSVVADLRQADPARTVDVRIAPGLAATGDPVLLRTALANLLENAWKFTGQRADAVIEVGFECGAPEREAVPLHAAAGTARLPVPAGNPVSQPAFFVRDNGVGFDMQYADKLFTPFQRLHAMTEFPGSGIGLATVQRVIHRHGGSVWFESAPGQGATFYFTIGANT